jgi:hypothetical protein
LPQQGQRAMALLETATRGGCATSVNGLCVLNARPGSQLTTSLKNRGQKTVVKRSDSAHLPQIKAGPDELIGFIGDNPGPLEVKDQLWLTTCEISTTAAFR